MTAQNILVWFRNDFRMLDNPALSYAIKAALDSQGKCVVYACVIMSPAEDLKHDRSSSQIDFVLRNLELLSKGLYDRHKIPLLYKKAQNGHDVIGSVKGFITDLNVRHVYINNQYEVDESRRDKKIAEELQSMNVELHRFHDQIVVPPGTLKTKSTDKPFTVYTPYRKAWQQHVYDHQNLLELHDPLPFMNENCVVKPDTIPKQLDEFPLLDSVKQSMLVEFPAGEVQAHLKLTQYADDRMETYKRNRDIPSYDSTSKLSPYLAIGVISSRQCVREAMSRNNNKLDQGKEGMVHWIQEVVWREFYKDILYSFPRVCMNRPFKLETEQVKWLFDQQLYDAWCQGKTGYPIVDAGMRQLNATGWMHNRLRMITASFLTKHLLHNWMDGEKYFSQKLIDCDFSSNNGGWQWTASTGVDSQPYFRIFNPLLQSQKFDSDGQFIKKWVPELATLSADVIHYPQQKLSDAEIQRLGYVPRVVDHEFGRKRAIAAFESAKALDPKILEAQQKKSPYKKQPSKKQRKAEA